MRMSNSEHNVFKFRLNTLKRIRKYVCCVRNIHERVGVHFYYDTVRPSIIENTKQLQERLSQNDRKENTSIVCVFIAIKFYLPFIYCFLFDNQSLRSNIELNITT